MNTYSFVWQREMRAAIRHSYGLAGAKGENLPYPEGHELWVARPIDKNGTELWPSPDFQMTAFHPNNANVMTNVAVKVRNSINVSLGL